MLPAFAIDNDADNRWANTIFGSKLSTVAAPVSATYGNHIFGGELGLPACFAMILIAAFLLHHIVNVILRRANKEMGRINTRWIVTRMTDKRIWRNRAVMDFVTDTVRWGIGMLCVACANMAVTVFVAVGRPFPAIIGATLVDLLPKAFGQWRTRESFPFHAMPDKKAALTAREFWFGKGRAASASAECGIMGLHKNLQFLCQAQDDSSRRWALSIGLLPVHYSTSGLVGEAI